MVTQTGSIVVGFHRKTIVRKKQMDVDKPVDPVSNLVRRNFVPHGTQPRPLIMGIDPGLHGAIAVIDMDTKTIVDMIDIPTFRKPTEARKQGYFEMLDIHKLSSLLDLYAPLTAAAILEEPGAMPEQGLSSTFRFGHVCGQIHGVLAGHYVPVMPVKPAAWKAAMALSDKKEDSLLRASIEYPQFKELWRLKGQNDRAEAALLCVYAMKYLKPFLELNRR